MSKTLAELQDAVQAARTARYEVEARRMKARADAMGAIRAQFADEMENAHLTLVAAESAVMLELDRLARTGEGAALPVGTLAVEWSLPKWQRRPWIKTGRSGVIEMVTLDSEFPANRAKPWIGSTILRIRNKDSRLGKLYERVSTASWPYGWFEEGVDPNAESE